MVEDVFAKLPKDARINVYVVHEMSHRAFSDRRQLFAPIHSRRTQMASATERGSADK
jgi:hypothetical protein